ncbi:MAG: EVE domain-containing protein [Gammaproteobacteria bacterium]|nr:EVE domain-containing protein [Gammaproteobacteria bacterium]
MNYWLLKSEPDAFSITDLAQRPGRTEHWDGVRNYQARNYLRDSMRRGDLAFFYHSSCAAPGIAGIVEIVREGYPDFTAFDPFDTHYDPASTPDKPRWYMVDVRLRRAFKHVISLQELKSCPPLEDMKLLARGNRLSVMPLTPAEWSAILDLE